MKRLSYVTSLLSSLLLLNTSFADTAILGGASYDTLYENFVIADTMSTNEKVAYPINIPGSNRGTIYSIAVSSDGLGSGQK